MLNIAIQEKKIQNLIKRTIIESVQGVLTDPDYGIGVRKEVAERLNKYSKKTSKKPISLAEIRRKHL